MNEENEQNTESTQPQPSLGERLKNGREDANVSIETLAKKLKLNVLQLQRLENDEHHLLGPMTFVKGYAKSYCREFDLDTPTIMALFPEPQETFKKAKMQSFSKRTEKEANDSKLMLLSYIILAVAIGSSALWWWQNTTPLNKEVITQPLSGFNTSENPVPTEISSEPLNSELAGPDEQTNGEEPDNAQAIGESAILQTSPNVETQSKPTKADNKSSSTINMHFDEDSWVEIHDGNGDKVAFGVKKAGYDMTLTGKPPFSVVLGKHQAVDIMLDGESVDISNFPKNRLAKFNLPLAE